MKYSYADYCRARAAILNDFLAGKRTKGQAQFALRIVQIGYLRAIA